jgi:hypothetical protein
MRNVMLYIVAKSANQANDYTYSRGLSVLEARPVRSVNSLYGIDRGMKVVCIGNYYERKDWPDLQTMLRAREAVVTVEHDW